MRQQVQTTVLGREDSLELSGTLTGYWVVFLRLLAGWWFLREGLNKYVTPGTFRTGWFLEKTGTLVFGAGRVWGIDSYLESTDVVRQRPWLRYLLG